MAKALSKTTGIRLTDGRCGRDARTTAGETRALLFDIGMKFSSQDASVYMGCKGPLIEDVEQQSSNPAALILCRIISREAMVSSADSSGRAEQSWRQECKVGSGQWFLVPWGRALCSWSLGARLRA
jgi:hypothetical protein